MSYILEALKKTEHEKNKKARPDGRVNISGDLFQERKKSTAKSGIWKVLVLIALASLVTFAGTWFVFHGDSAKNVTVLRPPAPQISAPVNSSVVTPAISIPVQSRVTTAGVPAAAVPVGSKNTETVADEDSSPRKVRRSKKQAEARLRPSSPKQSVQTVQAPADIKLSGIAWQDERSARRAVVNGFLLKEGAVVAGAKISDIQADRVRFSSSGGVFEIKLDAVLPAGVQR